MGRGGGDAYNWKKTEEEEGMFAVAITTDITVFLGKGMEQKKTYDENNGSFPLL